MFKVYSVRDTARLNRLVESQELSMNEILRAGIRVWEERKKLLPITKEEIDQYQ